MKSAFYVAHRVREGERQEGCGQAGAQSWSQESLPVTRFSFQDKPLNAACPEPPVSGLAKKIRFNQTNLGCLPVKLSLLGTVASNFNKGYSDVILINLALRIIFSAISLNSSLLK